MHLSPDEIPSISQLYHLRELHPSSTTSSHTPSQSHNDKVSLIKTDITTLSTSAIVNAANKSLLGGGGVDGAIHRAAGPRLLDECRTLNGCSTGSAKITSAYDLPCEHVIHAVGPVYSSYTPVEAAEKLKGCYKKSLELAVENGCTSIAFSGISTGVYGFPRGEAAGVACGVVREFLEADKGGLDKVVFVCFEERDVRAYNEVLP